MVARGDLGVELPPEGVPPLQNRIVAAARQAGKPVVVATQMLESMIVSPTPTRAEVSDVANAIYEGADAVMLSAESAAGAFPVEAVAMMDKIGRSVEADPVYSARIHFTETPAEATTADALSESAAQIVRILSASAMACYTSSGSTARRIARERAQVPTLAMTASMKVARRLGLQWGVHAVHTRDVNNFEEMVGKAKRMVLRHHLAEAGDRVLIMAGVPFRTSGSTNVIHVVKIVGDELESYSNEVSPARGGDFHRLISRARKPTGPIFFASACPASPWSQTAHSRAVRGSAPRASRPPTIPASASPEPATPSPGPPPLIIPGTSVRGDDMAVRPLDQDQGAIRNGALLRGRKPAGRPPPLPVATDQRCHFAGHGAAGSAIAASRASLSSGARPRSIAASSTSGAGMRTSS